KCEGRPEFAARGKADALAHHADHRERASVQLDLAAYDVGIAREETLPEAEAEHGDLILAGQVFTGGEGAAEDRFCAQSIEEIRRDDAGVDRFRIATLRDVEVHL